MQSQFTPCACGCDGIVAATGHRGQADGPARFIHHHVRRDYERTPLVDRFWPKVNKTETCWLWVGMKDLVGYGLIRRGAANAGMAKAHRVSWELANGKTIPKGMIVCHRCDVPSCVNPDHLFVGTIADNNHDMMSKGRHVAPRGTQVVFSRMSDDAVRVVRVAYKAGCSQVALATAFQVNRRTIANIINGITWTHVEQRPHREIAHRGAGNPRSKLTEEMVIEARQLRASGMTYAALGLRYGISGVNIMKAVKGINWAHVPALTCLEPQELQIQ